MKLTTAQRLELLRHKIPIFDVFDAAGMTLTEAKAAMSRNKEAVMINGLACKNDEQHKLRSRYGKCVGCNPATVEMQRRKRRPAAVYLAETPQLGMVKVGMSVDHKVRLGRLNFYGYGGASDWRFVAVARSDHAGKLEHEIQDALSSHRELITYRKDGDEQICYELFRCPTPIAYSHFLRCAESEGAELIQKPGHMP